jgi:hypothetical protein
MATRTDGDGRAGGDRGRLATGRTSTRARRRCSRSSSCATTCSPTTTNDVIEEWDLQLQGHRQQRHRARHPPAHPNGCKANGYKWFREVLLVMGRRAGKGHIGALAMAYVLWNYMAKGDPQGFYGVDRDKRLACLIFAGKRDQAKATVFGDVVNNVITEARLLRPVHQPEPGRAAVDLRPARLRPDEEDGRPGSAHRARHGHLRDPAEGVHPDGRSWPDVVHAGYDEMAHVVALGANRSAEEVYTAAKPVARPVRQGRLHLRAVQPLADDGPVLRELPAPSPTTRRRPGRTPTS